MDGVLKGAIGTEKDQKVSIPTLDTDRAPSTWSDALSEGGLAEPDRSSTAFFVLLNASASRRQALLSLLNERQVGGGFRMRMYRRECYVRKVDGLAEGAASDVGSHDEESRTVKDEEVGDRRKALSTMFSSTSSDGDQLRSLTEKKSRFPLSKLQPQPRPLSSASCLSPNSNGSDY